LKRLGEGRWEKRAKSWAKVRALRWLPPKWRAERMARVRMVLEGVLV